MAIRNIRKEGDEILKKKSREVEEIDEKICEFSPKQVVLDLSQTVISHPFDLKCAVGLIVGRHRLLEELQAELVIENPNPHTLKCLKSNGVDKLIKIVNSK